MKKSVGGTDTIVEVGGSASGIASSFIAYEYTATANQTTFSGTDNNSNTLAYNTGTPPSVQVFMNGILLDEGSSQDYTGTNGTSVVLTTAADAGDLIQIHAYKSDVSIVNNLNFNDNQKLQFGDSQDLQIYHNGSNSVIKDAGTGKLLIGSDVLAIRNVALNEDMLTATQNGAVKLFYDNSKKLETTSTGIDVTGTITFDGGTTSANLNFGDGDKAVFGNSSDLQIYHDGSNSYIKENGTGNLYLQGTSLVVSNSVGANYLVAYDGGSVNLYHNANQKLATTSLGIDITGEVQADSLDIDGLSVLTSNNNATPLTLERASPTSNQVGIQFSAGNSRYFGKGTDDEPYWATSANLTGGSKIVTAGNFTGILDSTYYQSGDNISVGTISSGAITTSGDLLISKTDPTITLLDNSGANTNPNGTIIFSEVSGTSNFKINYNGQNDRLEFRGLIGSTDTELVRINRSTNPALHTFGRQYIEYSVQATANKAYGLVVRGNDSGSTGEASSIFLGGIQNTVRGAYLAAEIQSTANDHDLIIATSGPSAEPSERMRVTGDGNVAIGNTTAGAKLDIRQDSGYAIRAENSSGHYFRVAAGGAIEVGGSAFVDASRNISAANITTTGYLRGPSTFTIDPAAHGDDTGTVVIAGNLQIDGTTTTINSTTLTVDDKNITLASGSANKAAANSAGITVDCGSDTDARITYASTTDEWDINKSIHVSGAAGSGVKINSGAAIVGGGATGGDTQLMYWNGSAVAYGRSSLGGTVSGHEFRVGGVTKLNVNSSGNTIASGTVSVLGGEIYLGTADSSSGHINAFENMTFNIDSDNDDTNRSFEWNINGNSSSGTELMRLTEAGNLGIGTNNPSAALHISGTSADQIRLERTNHDTFRIGLQSAVGLGFHNVTDNRTDMMIKGDGKVGIGTTSPTEKLHIHAGGIYSTPITYAANQDNWGLKLGASNNAGWDYAGIKLRVDGTGSPRMALMSAGSLETISLWGGKVGIGTTAPTHKLHVAGDIRIDNGSALKLYNSAGNAWAQIAYNNTLDHIEIQRSFQSSTDSYYNLGSSGKKWLSVYSDTIKASNGTPAAPTYTFDSDQNTGMYIDSQADTLRFSAGGAQRMYLNTAGITSASNVYTASVGEFRNYGGTWKATTGTAAGDFEFRGNTGGTNTGLMYMDTSTGRVAVGDGFNSTNVKSEFQVDHAGIDTYAVNTSATSAAQVDTFPAADFRSARFTVQITNTTDSTYQITEILLIHDGTTPSMTEYGTIFTGSAAEATFDADIVSGNIRLLATPASADSMQFKVVRHSILV